MTLRCFLFSSDEGTSDIIRQVLTGLAVEGESCPTPSTAVEKVANESFHLVIIDWDQQPEAGMVLGAARERKAAERPLTLAIVSDDASVPKALQAGANSILRKPLLVTQATDTLTTARDLLRSKFESAPKPQAAAAAASADATSVHAARGDAGEEKTLRAGEFLQSAPLNPRQIVTESEIPNYPDQSVPEPVDQLKDLEPVAAPAPPPPPPPARDEPRGLEWYLKRKGLNSAVAPAPAPVPNDKPELLGYDQTPSSSAALAGNGSAEDPTPPPDSSSHHEQRKEAELFAYISGETSERKESSPSRFRLAKGPIIGAMVLAAIAVFAAPQAPWHPELKSLWVRGQRSLHAWLNPQPVTAVAQAPTAHEDFGRAGDEYKLPVAETIPDATTDPSQIQVLPAVDPTAKKPAADSSTTDQTPSPADTTTSTPSSAADGSQPAVQVQENQPVQPAPSATSPAPPAGTSSAPAATTIASNAPAHTEPPTIVTTPIPSTSQPAPPAPPRRQPAPYVVPTTKVPSSLQSQMAVMVPDASGNKPVDSAMPTIEPVNVPELTERALLTDQPTMPYPANIKGQQGTVILQVLVGRDGIVQDAKFLQGSLAFARTAIDGVRQWKFKPYTMNGRPVSVQTTITIKFKPAQ